MSSAVLNAVLNAAGVTAEVSDETLGALARVAPADVTAALAALRDGDAAFALLVDLFVTDTGEELEVTYHVRSYARDEDAYVRTTAPYDGDVPSIWRVHPAALYPEREAAELFGMSFPGHPNPKRLLTTDELELPLLRRSTPIRTDEEVHDR